MVMRLGLPCSALFGVVYTILCIPIMWPYTFYEPSNLAFAATVAIRCVGFLAHLLNRSRPIDDGIDHVDPEDLIADA